MLAIPDLQHDRRLNLPGKPADGSALLFVLLVLSIISLLGLFMTVDAVTGLHISDNYESRERASCASITGLDHAHALMRGRNFNAFLVGPDGDFDSSSSYLELAGKYEFRNPISVSLAQSLNLSNPEADVSGLPDDGLLNTGFHNGTAGIPLIPLTGIARKSPKPDGPEEFISSRYFVKVADNNGDASELEGDPGDSPFSDGDGVVIVRSMGVAGTIPDFTGSVPRKNSIVVYEGRFRRYSVFDSAPALLVLGSRVLPIFDGDYEIDGGLFPGIGVIDTDEADAVLPGSIIGSGPFGMGIITGAGLPSPSVQDMTRQVVSDTERSRILDPLYLQRFLYGTAPKIADNYYTGPQYWDPGTVPDIGSYDPEEPYNAPEQNPKLTVVQGDLRMTGDICGGGLLIVTGELQLLDSTRFDGLILVIGSGRLIVDTAGSGITGGVVLANLNEEHGEAEFGMPTFSIRGNSSIRADAGAVETAQSLIPPVRVGFREIAGTDP